MQAILKEKHCVWRMSRLANTTMLVFLFFRRPFATAALVFVVHLYPSGGLMYRHRFANIHRGASINARGEDGSRQDIAQGSASG